MSLPAEQIAPDVVILGASFSDDYEVINIQYMEARHVAPKAWKKEEITLDASLVNRDEIADLVESLQQFVDLALLHIRKEGGPA